MKTSSRAIDNLNWLGAELASWFVFIVLRDIIQCFLWQCFQRFEWQGNAKRLDVTSLFPAITGVKWADLHKLNNAKRLHKQNCSNSVCVTLILCKTWISKSFFQDVIYPGIILTAGRLIKTFSLQFLMIFLTLMRIFKLQLTQGEYWRQATNHRRETAANLGRF